MPPARPLAAMGHPRRPAFQRPEVGAAEGQEERALPGRDPVEHGQRRQARPGELPGHRRPHAVLALDTQARRVQRQEPAVRGYPRIKPQGRRQGDPGHVLGHAHADLVRPDLTIAVRGDFVGHGHTTKSPRPEPTEPSEAGMTHATVAQATTALLSPLLAVAQTTAAIEQHPAATASAVSTRVAAPPHRADGKSRPVIFVHGFDREADTNCAAAWKNARIVLRKHHWKARSYTFGYYGRDRNCNMHAKGTTDTRIQDVGAALARRIYKHFTSKGVAVDIVAHSMGGLVAKAAIQGTNKYGGQSRKWPSRLYVEDVVTLGTPHLGANFPPE